MTEDPNADDELPRGVALAWGVAAAPQRGPKREMSVERIVEVAVELADAEGLAAVSMAALAARLGYTPMSLYRYVSAKDDLILLMLEEATGLPPEPDAEVDADSGGGAWRPRLEQLYRAMVARYVMHPWMLEIPISGSPTTPNSAAWMDAGIAALRRTRLSHQERLAAVLLITGHARWCGSVIAAYGRVAREQQVTDAQISAREDALFRQLISPDSYPALREAIDDGVFLDDADPFAFGVARALDGMASYVARLEDGGEPDEPVGFAVVDPEVVADKRHVQAQKAVRAAERALRDARTALRRVERELGNRRGDR